MGDCDQVSAIAMQAAVEIEVASSLGTNTLGLAKIIDRAIKQQAEVSDWRLIETAPKDGTPVLTFSADAAADPKVGPYNNPGSPILVCAYTMSEFEMVDEEGNIQLNCYEPTHWMPLPTPPENT